MATTPHIVRIVGLGSVFILSACGSDGGNAVNSVSGPGIAANTPTAVTPSSLSSSTSFSNTMQSGGFVTIRASGTTDTPYSSGADTVKTDVSDKTNYISYDAATNLYTINFINASGQATKDTFNPNANTAGGVIQSTTATGSPDPTEVNYNTSACYMSGCYYTAHVISHTGNDGFIYTYTAFASSTSSSWKITNGSSSSNDFSVFGFPTATSAIPRSGNATYALDLVGTYTGTGSGSVNFGNGTYNFAGNIAQTSGSVQTTGTFQSTGTLANAANGFSGSVSLAVNQTIANTAPGTNTINNYTFNGPIGGMFFGPAAQELGGTFVASNTSSRSTSSGATPPGPAYGAILGHR